MIVEVFENGQTIGFVTGQDRLSVADTVSKAFPQVDRVAVVRSLPRYDERCKEIAKNIYAWA